MDCTSLRRLFLCFNWDCLLYCRLAGWIQTCKVMWLRGKANCNCVV